ncbi:MAG: hypothetical protein R3E88_03400 [Myxococcota bacterium]
MKSTAKRRAPVRPSIATSPCPRVVEYTTPSPPTEGDAAAAVSSARQTSAPVAASTATITPSSPAAYTSAPSGEIAGLVPLPCAIGCANATTGPSGVVSMP